MTPAERETFKQKMSADPNLPSRVDEVRLLITGMQEAVLTEKLDQFHQAAAQQRPAVSKRRPLGRWLAAASVLLLIAAGLWWFGAQNSREQRLFTHYYQQDPGLITAMSNTDHYAFDRAMVDYKTGKYQEAIRTWESLLESKPGNDTLNYFIGNASLALKDYKKGIRSLEKVTSLSKSYFLADAHWYLGLALLHDGQTEAAEQHISRSDHPQKQEILSRLK